jgi:AcrR family transcriptional regulator
MHEVARAAGVPLTTLYNWKKHYYPDSQWRPGHPTSGSRRVFTDQEEKEITDHIRSHYLSKHLPLTMSNMRALILKWYQTYLQHAPRDLEAAVPIRCRKFHCVRHFLRQFMTRNHLSYRCVRAARRCEVRSDEVERFQRELLAAYRDFPQSDIVNADESVWLVLWQTHKTIAEKGVESVKIQVSGDPKAGFTFIGTITARGQRLPLFLVAKGRTPKCHK